MRLAVLSDVHGNLQALEAVLEHAQKQKVDQIIIAGDLVNVLPDSRACWDLVKSLNLPMVRGNHERYLAQFGTEKLDWSGERFLPIAWTLKQFSSDERKTVEQLPLHLHLDNLLVVHASFRDDYDTVMPNTPTDEVEKMFTGSYESFIVRGHNHNSFDLSFNNRHLESLGSAGLPLDGSPKADYVILEQTKTSWRVMRQEIDYDMDKAVKRFEKTGYLEEAGPMVKLFRQELLTSRWQLIPFWNEYKKWSHNETLTLGQAIDAFLAAQGY
jgi:predicted phosphodiesterase